MKLELGWKRLAATQWRYTIKVMLAAAAGYALTQGTENQYAIYSAFAAALVVGSSLGEDITASANRVKGTVAGMLAGMGVSWLFGPSLATIALAVGLTALLAVGLGWGVPAARIGVTLCIITLVTHRADALEYNAFRALNTLIGVAVGLAVSLLVWPVRAHHAVRKGLDGALDAAARLLDALADGEASLRPLEASLFDQLSAVVKAAREGNVERQLLPAEEMDPRALQVLQLGMEILAVALAAEARGGENKAPDVEPLRARLQALRRP